MDNADIIAIVRRAMEEAEAAGYPELAYERADMALFKRGIYSDPTETLAADERAEGPMECITVLIDGREIWRNTETGEITIQKGE